MNITVLNTKDQFNAAYLGSLPPAVVAAMNASDAATRQNALLGIATAGYPVDVPIMMNGWDPYEVMLARTLFGFTWVPTLLMPSIAVLPGATYLPAGVQPYDPTPPKGAIIVVDPRTVDLGAFYPPALPAGPLLEVPPPYVGPSANIGFPGTFNWATPNGLAKLGHMKDGDMIAENGHAYARFSFGGMIGTYVLWAQK